MAATTAFANSLLELLFNGTPIPNIADNAGSSPATVLWISLHTASPGVSGNQTTNEAAYTGYTRISVARTSGGWTIAGNSVSPVAPIVFPTASGGSETETFMGVGLAGSGAGVLQDYFAISPTIVVSTGIQPKLTTATAITVT